MYNLLESVSLRRVVGEVAPDQECDLGVEGCFPQTHGQSNYQDYCQGRGQEWCLICVSKWCQVREVQK